MVSATEALTCSSSPQQKGPTMASANPCKSSCLSRLPSLHLKAFPTDNKKIQVVYHGLLHVENNV